MSNIEHLIENALTAMSEKPDDAYQAFIDAMSATYNQQMLQEVSVTEAELWAIAQYTVYTWMPNIDAVEVVRCKDCLHSRELNKYEKKLYLDECVGCTRHSVSYHDAIMMGDDFCSYGERRDGDV